jgi:hypothetical protein
LPQILMATGWLQSLMTKQVDLGKKKKKKELTD